MMSETPPDDLRLHIDDLQDILASIIFDDLAGVESAWYEYWNCVLNYWIRRISDSKMRLSIAPQRQLIREVLLDKTEVDHDWSFEVDTGDTSLDFSTSGDPPAVTIQERIAEARVGINTEYRVPDFIAFALRSQGLPHRRLLCIIEIKPPKDVPDSILSIYTTQIVTQAKFAFDAFPDLRHILFIFAIGDSWRMYRFPRSELTQAYLKGVGGYGDEDTFDPARASRKPRSIDISPFIIIPSSNVLKADGLNYTAAFEEAVGFITSVLKAS